MLRILESQAPAKQTATDTINTLSNRLSSATLLEDRRAAILGLRSFAKLYPASVASGALRDLLAGLRRDGEDPDTLKVVLETLLMLFEPDEKSPEASEDIPLWLADEFTQRRDNITALLDMLETNEFYLRLYSLQILAQVCTARPQRAQEAIFTAPLGVSRITAVLDDRREASRNEALLLLVALTPTSAELQKVVAFENAFERTFALIEGEGGLTHGSTTVQDCLSLLGNLLKLNTSNQSYFREIGCVKRVSKLLADVIREEESPDGVSEWMRPQRDINLWGLLAVLQLFLIRGSQGTPLSQEAFWKTGVLQRVLQIAFHETFGTNVRAKALETCADIIRANANLQEQFGDLAVPALKQSTAAMTNGHSTPVPGQKSRNATPAPVQMSNVIESLLELTLEPSAISIFDVRLAACNCVKAFLEGHSGIRGHVLRRAIEGHRSGEDAIPNILTVLLEPPNTRTSADPYQQWMAALLLLHLLYDNSETKAMALKVSENEEETDEEYEKVTFLQSITSNVVAGVQHPEDERALLGYLMLISTWLFEDPDAVNDLLGEGSTVQGLASAVKVASPTMPLVAGLCALVLGIIYEFSTKDSPIPRATVNGVIHKSLTREVYVERLNKVRESPFIRDFEVMPTTSDSGLPEVYFDQTFVDFFKDNFSRLLRAIDRDPGFEVSVIANGVQKGVSRELVDTLRGELSEAKRGLERAESELVHLRQKVEQEELEHRRTRDSTAVELNRIKQINQSLHDNHDQEVQKLQQDLARQNETLTNNHESTVSQLRREHLTAIEQLTRQHKAEKDYLEQRRSGAERELIKAKDNISKHQADEEKAVLDAKRIQDELHSEVESLKNTIQKLQGELSQARTEHDRNSKVAKEELEKKLSSAESQVKKLQQDLTSLQSELKAAKDEVKTSKTKLQDTESKSSSSQATLQKALEKAKTAESRNKDLNKKIENLEAAAAKQQKQHEEEKKKLTVAASTASRKEKNAPAGPKISDKELDDLRAAAAKQKDTQTELDDLLVVFADLEAKRMKEKKRLRELGEEVSEDDDDEEEAEEEAEEEEEEADEGDEDEEKSEGQVEGRESDLD